MRESYIFISLTELRISCSSWAITACSTFDVSHHLMMTQKYQSPVIWSAVISSSLCFMTQIHACDGTIFELHLGDWLHASHGHNTMFYQSGRMDVIVHDNGRRLQANTTYFMETVGRTLIVKCKHTATSSKDISCYCIERVRCILLSICIRSVRPTISRASDIFL